VLYSVKKHAVKLSVTAIKMLVAVQQLIFGHLPIRQFSLKVTRIIMS
jgi:hypothetical protein